MSLSRLQLMRSRRLTSRLHPTLKPHPTRSLLLIRRQQLVRSLPRILRKKRLKQKRVLESSKLAATHCVRLFQV